MAQLNNIAQYVNQMLQNYSPVSARLPVTPDDLLQQMHDGILLCCLANVISPGQEQFIDPRTIKFQKATLFHKIDNVNRALDALKCMNIPLINIRAEFIVEKKQKSLLGLFSQVTKQKPAPMKQGQEPRKQQKIENKIQNKENEVRKTEQEEYWEEEQKIEIKGEREEIKAEEDKKEEQLQSSNVFQKEQKQIYAEQEEQKFEEQTQNREILINGDPLIEHACNNGYLFQESLGTTILTLCGSLRKQSCNMGIVKGLQTIKGKQFFENIHFQQVDLSILPLFNEDFARQSRIPKAVSDLISQIKKVSGVLIATPQYNQCLSPVVKNALDWITLTQDSVLTLKKIGVVGASYIDESAINDVIKICKNNGANVFPQIFYLSLKQKAFDESGDLSSDEHIDRLSLWYQDFSHFVISDKEQPEPIPRFIS